MRVILALCLTVSPLLFGCSSYPLPEDVTQASTSDIARIVRCEIRSAIRSEIISYISNPKYKVGYDGKTGLEEGILLRSNPSQFQKLDWNLFTPDLAKHAFNVYKNAIISYDYTLHGTQINSGGVSVDILGKFQKRTDNINLKLQADLTRDATRHFRIFDNFDILAKTMPERMCDNVPGNPNIMYPMAGLLEFDSLVHQFIMLNEFDNLGAFDKDADFNTAEITDTVAFTTKVTANADPTFAITPVQQVFALSPISIVADNNRQDIHTVIIDIRLLPDLKNLPYFDEFGHLALAPKDKTKVAALTRAAALKSANAALDRQRGFNVQDSLVQIGNSISNGSFTPR